MPPVAIWDYRMKFLNATLNFDMCVLITLRIDIYRPIIQLIQQMCVFIYK